jgi:hypothetical protein
VIRSDTDDAVSVTIGHAGGGSGGRAAVGGRATEDTGESNVSNLILVGERDAKPSLSGGRSC